MPSLSEFADNDRTLIEQISFGDERALAKAYDRFGTLVYSIAYHILGDAADAEEVVADVFLQAWKRASTFDPGRATLAAWLSMITRSRALDLLRARNRRSRVVDQIAQSSVPLTETLAGELRVDIAELRSVVLRCLDGLTGEQRAAIELAYYGGLSQSEIAEQLVEPLGTIKTRIRTAMGKLKQCLGSYLLI